SIAGPGPFVTSQIGRALHVASITRACKGPVLGAGRYRAMVAYTAPAHQVAAEIVQLERAVDAEARSGGFIFRAERDPIDGKIARVLVRAEALPSDQGAPAVAELEHLQRLSRTGMLSLFAPLEVQALVEARLEMLKAARHDAHTDAFKGLGRGFARPF